MYEKDIFRGYEVGRWEIGPRLYKIFAAATVLAVLPLFIAGQMNLMSASACESPFVGRVCEVLDTVYTGAKIFAKDQGYIEKDYENLELARKNEVIWEQEIEGDPELLYPVGYFEVANRDELAQARLISEDLGNGFQNTPPALPPINPNPISPPKSRINPPVARNRGFSRKPVLPKRNPNILDGDLGDDPLGDIATNDDNGKKPDDGKVTKKTPDPNAVAANKKPGNTLENKTATSSNDADAVPINKKPLFDLVDMVVKQVDNNEVDLSQQFKIVFSGAIDDDGIMVVERSAITEAQGDEAMRELAIEAVQKVGASGFLRYLSVENVKNLDIIFGQNESQMIANVISDLKNPRKAKSTASALQLAMLLAKQTDRPADELLLLNSAKVVAEGNMVKITFNLDKPSAQKIIKERLAEYKIKKANEAKKTGDVGKPSGQISKPRVNANAGK